MGQQWRYLMADLARWPAPRLQEFLYNLLEPGLWATVIYRLGRACVLFPIPVVSIPFRILAMLLYKWNEIVFSVRLPPGTNIGPGLFIGHIGCVFFNQDVVAGRNLSIGPMTLIGAKGVGHQGVPILGDDVFIGTGSILIGPITIGDGARIGAGAVVTKDVPAHATAGGIPAEVRRRREEPPPHE